MGELGLRDRLQIVRPAPATAAELETVHTPAFVRWVRERVVSGEGRFDRSTPIYPGLYRRATVAVGATLLGARLIAGGTMRHAFNPSGGLHHAARERAAGFCVFNDVVVAVRALQREFGLRRPPAPGLATGRLLCVGGGGYTPEATARCWAIRVPTLTGEAPPVDPPCYGRLFDVDAAPADPAAMGQVHATVAALRSRLHLL